MVETAYAFTELNNDSLDNMDKFQSSRGYLISVEGHYNMFKANMNATRAVPGNGWEPAIPAPGNAWEKQALFEYDGKALLAKQLFSQP